MTVDVSKAWQTAFQYCKAGNAFMPFSFSVYMVSAIDSPIHVCVLKENNEFTYDMSLTT